MHAFYWHACFDGRHGSHVYSNKPDRFHIMCVVLYLLKFEMTTPRCSDVIFAVLFWSVVSILFRVLRRQLIFTVSK